MRFLAFIVRWLARFVGLGDSGRPAQMWGSSMHAVEVFENVRICRVEIFGSEINVDIYGGRVCLIGTATYEVKPNDRGAIVKTMVRWQNNETLLAYIHDGRQNGRLIEMSEYEKVGE